MYSIAKSTEKLFSIFLGKEWRRKSINYKSFFLQLKKKIYLY